MIRKHLTPASVLTPWISLFLFALFPMMSLCQNISQNTILWEAIEVTDLQTASTTALACQFITATNTSVEWIQKKGTLRTFYNVASVEGRWSDVSSPGSITFSLQRNDKHCKMTIEKTVSGTFITMDFSKENEYTSRLKFKIKSVK